MTQDTCTVEDCDKTARSGAAAHCHMHYSRLRRSGKLDAKPWHRRGACSVEGCSSAEEADTFCAKHYARWTRHGDVAITRRPRQTGSCSISECDRPKESRGLCKMHARRLRHNGDPLVVMQGKPQAGSLHHMWAGDDVSYEGWHARLRRERGPASLYDCADCGLPAHDWSYDHTSEDEKRSADGPYALDSRRYSPRCRRCHIQFDFAHTGRGRSI